MLARTWRLSVVKRTTVPSFMYIRIGPNSPAQRRIYTASIKDCLNVKIIIRSSSHCWTHSLAWSHWHVWDPGLSDLQAAHTHRNLLWLGSNSVAGHGRWLRDQYGQRQGRVLSGKISIGWLSHCFWLCHSHTAAAVWKNESCVASLYLTQPQLFATTTTSQAVPIELRNFVGICCGHVCGHVHSDRCAVDANFVCRDEEMTKINREMTNGAEFFCPRANLPSAYMTSSWNSVVFGASLRGQEGKPKIFLALSSGHWTLSLLCTP